jgi:hypothetical protein
MKPREQPTRPTDDLLPPPLVKLKLCDNEDDDGGANVIGGDGGG